MQQKYLLPHFKQQKCQCTFTLLQFGNWNTHILKTQVARVSTPSLRSGARKGTTNNFLCVPFQTQRETDREHKQNVKTREMFSTAYIINYIMNCQDCHLSQKKDGLSSKPKERWWVYIRIELTEKGQVCTMTV